MSKLNKKITLCAALLGLSLTTNLNAEILTTIKPLGFIVSELAQGVDNTKVLLPAGASPHGYNLKPSDVQATQNAKLIVWIGKNMEQFYAKSVAKVDPQKVINLSDIAAIDKIKDEFLAVWKENHAKDEENEHHHDHEHEGHDHHDHEHEGHDHHDHEHEGHDHHDHAHEGHDHHDHEDGDGHHHDHSLGDFHFWLSPQISKIAAEEIAKKLTAVYPDKAELIAKNLAGFEQSLEQVNGLIKTQLKPVQNKGYYVFHEAYNYFESFYGLHNLGAFSVNPGAGVGAKKLSEIKEAVEHNKAQCLFVEPQFTPKVVETLADNTGAKVGHLDPLGTKIDLGKGSYAKFLQQISASFYSCLN